MQVTDQVDRLRGAIRSYFDDIDRLRGESLGELAFTLVDALQSAVEDEDFSLAKDICAELASLDLTETSIRFSSVLDRLGEVISRDPRNSLPEAKVILNKWESIVNPPLPVPASAIPVSVGVIEVDAPKIDEKEKISSEKLLTKPSNKQEKQKVDTIKPPAEKDAPTPAGGKVNKALLEKYKKMYQDNSKKQVPNSVIVDVMPRMKSGSSLSFKPSSTHSNTRGSSSLRTTSSVLQKVTSPGMRPPIGAPPRSAIPNKQPAVVITQKNVRNSMFVGTTYIY
jgi:hypothetical protein